MSFLNQRAISENHEQNCQKWFPNWVGLAHLKKKNEYCHCNPTLNPICNKYSMLWIHSTLLLPRKNFVQFEVAIFGV